MSSFTTNPNRKKYDVYLSFCVEDARSFATGIYRALSLEAGIIVHWDDERLGNGDHREMATSVLNVIEDCKVVVIIFSRNYFNSRSCLQELEKITECCRTTDSLMLLTFFFYVGVRLSFGILERGMFRGEAFHDFLNKISMEEETSKEEDKFMTWVALISKATVYSEETSDLG
ncbi:NBS-containing resistance-like protein [Trifolium medium]|uniref:NBS-containing resistance-like protein n=1 Tax=Trifolium medium TaxID=97028 RepID=A0A392QG56_9FABA|nr:NBS-containing resistance-like protein [Trifolium medium]